MGTNREKGVYIIAEAGVNHNGSLTMAKELLQIAKNAGADAVKFQTFQAENIVTKDAEKARYQKENMSSEDAVQLSMLKRLELPFEDFLELAAYAKRLSIDFLSTPFDEKSLFSYGADAYALSEDSFRRDYECTVSSDLCKNKYACSPVHGHEFLRRGRDGARCAFLWLHDRRSTFIAAGFLPCLCIC